MAIAAGHTAANSRTPSCGELYVALQQCSPDPSRHRKYTVAQIAYAVWRAVVLCRCEDDDACETRLGGPDARTVLFTLPSVNHMNRSRMPWLTTCHRIIARGDRTGKALRVTQGLYGCGVNSLSAAHAQ